LKLERASQLMAAVGADCTLRMARPARQSLVRQL
jgi:hypothetical protein